MGRRNTYRRPDGKRAIRHIITEYITADDLRDAVLHRVTVMGDDWPTTQRGVFDARRTQLAVDGHNFDDDEVSEEDIERAVALIARLFPNLFD